MTISARIASWAGHRLIPLPSFLRAAGLPSASSVRQVIGTSPVTGLSPRVGDHRFLDQGLCDHFTNAARGLHPAIPDTDEAFRFWDAAARERLHAPLEELLMRQRGY